MKPTAISTGAIDSLIKDLRSEDGRVREAARSRIVALGASAVHPLTGLVADPNPQVRWEAVKALSAIHDRRTCPALVAALEDERPGVRWMAAEGLVALRHRALPQLLRRMATGMYSVQLIESAHHVLRPLSDEIYHQELTPVIDALERRDPSVAIA